MKTRNRYFAQSRVLDRSRTARSVCVAACVLILIGCGGNEALTGPGSGLPIDTSGEIIYSRTRNTAGAIVPVLQEGTGGFDSQAVDSPSVAVDSGRPGGDRYLLYYEADGPGGTTIGLVTSSEEDLLPLAMGRTQVVGLGATGGPYESAATDPTVLVDKRPGQEQQRYKMWFEGRGGAGGQTSTILYGTSADGVNWSAFTPCTGLTPAYAQVRVADPCVVFDGTKFRMWFEGINSAIGGNDGPGVIGYAESDDGVAWTLKDAAGNTQSAAGPVFSPAGGSVFDAYTVNSPGVVIDAGDAAAPFKMWYEAGDQAGDVQNTIGYAVSNDGLNWARFTLPVLAPSSDARVPLPFDSGDLEHPCAAIDPSLPVGTDGHFLLWYAGDAEGNTSPNRIGLATGRSP